jgi:hypothetical protein
MRTIRRLYFYSVAFISLEVVLWGLIGLLRSIFVPAATGGNTTLLAQGLALILVGVPVFGLHWWVVQRDARREADEHTSGMRAFFLYAVLLSTFIPVIQNFLAAVNRLFLETSHLSRTAAFVGSQQTWSDNLIALLMNTLIGVYFISVLRADWKQIAVQGAFLFVRRISRYLWVLYGLLLMVAGVQQILTFILQIPPSIFGTLLKATFINGLSLTLVGTPLWVWAWKTVQDSLIEPEERESLLRLGLLYALSLGSVLTVLASGGIILYLLLRLVLGESILLPEFSRLVSGPLSIGLPLAGVWAYFGKWLAQAIADTSGAAYYIKEPGLPRPVLETGLPRPVQEPGLPRRGGMRRLYSYILSAIGLAATFIGLRMVLAFVVDALLAGQVWGGSLRLSLAASLATLGVGLPLWLLTWRPMQAQALMPGDAGDHARRSIIRRIYLYLALFASVIGGMISAGSLVYLLLKALLGGGTAGVLPGSLKAFEIFVLFVLLGVYHGLKLRQDGKASSLALIEKHAAFPTLIFDRENGTFGAAMLAAIQKQTPKLPALIHLANQSLAKTDPPRAILLPADLALDPPVPLRVWLGKFSGPRFVVALPSPKPAPEHPATGWVWVGGPATDLNQAALALRQIAEGQEVRQKAPVTGWMVFLYVLAGLFGVQILGLLVSLVASSIFR